MKQHLSLYDYSGQPMFGVRRPAARHVQAAGHCPQHCAHELFSSLCTALCSISVLISSLFHSYCTTRRGIPAQQKTELVTDPWRIARRPGIPTCPHKRSPMRFLPWWSRQEPIMVQYMSPPPRAQYVSPPRNHVHNRVVYGEY